MADAFHAGINLGQLVGGRGDPKARLEAEGKTYRNEEAMESARIERAKRMAYEALPDAMRADPQLGQRADLNIALGTINPNLSVLTEGNIKLGELQAQEQRRLALSAGDIPGYNQQTALQTGKEYQPVRVVGGTMMPNGVDLGAETFETVPTPESLARIEATEARVQQGQQRTNATVAKASRAPQSGGARKPGGLDPTILEQARERIQSGGRSAKEVHDHLVRMGYPKEAAEIYKPAKK